MRKITEAAARAFRDRAQFQSANTRVRVDETRGSRDRPRVELLLHGHCVAWQDDLEGSHAVRVTLAGYPTLTTRERINGLLAILGFNAQVFQRAGVQYLEYRAAGKRFEREIHPYEAVTIPPESRDP